MQIGKALKRRKLQANICENLKFSEESLQQFVTKAHNKLCQPTHIVFVYVLYKQKSMLLHPFFPKGP